MKLSFKEMTLEEQQEYAKVLLQQIDSREAMKEWIMAFLGLDMPIGQVDPDSNSSPIDSIWEIYNTIKNNKGDENPGYIMLSAREGYKTLGASILEVLLMIHFRLTIAHMAAIQSQSAKAVQYINYFFTKIEPLLLAAGWTKTSESKNKISFRTDQDEDVYVRVVVATMAGANCIDPGAIISTKDRGEIRAAEIEKGDMVLTRDYKSNKDVYVTVYGVQTTNKLSRKIKLKSGRCIVVSDDHPIFTDSGWLRASKIRIGDKTITNSALSFGESAVFLESKVDTGNMTIRNRINRKTFACNKNPNLKHERELKKSIDSQFNDEVVSIELLGSIDLIDISISNIDKTLHSFYANGILVHNSEHTNLLVVDEIDVVQNPQAYEEAKLIPGFSKGFHPLTIKLSTRKFSFGLMQKEIDMAPVSGDKILRWNILDVTERCDESIHKPELPRKDLYIANNLPLKSISENEYNALSDTEKTAYSLYKDAYAGCHTCPLASVCKGKLASRPVNAKGGLHKPISSVINTFKKVSPDMGEAQLLCWKPSSKGLVYSRFDGEINKGNVISLEKAWETITGDTVNKGSIKEYQLHQKIVSLDIPIYVGVDWGYTHDFVMVFFAIIPNGEVWVIDCYSQAGLEFSDCLKVAMEYRDKYNPIKWYADTAMPSHLKSFTKNGMKTAKFTKDVMGGIEALRSKIVDGSGKRYLKVLHTEANKKVINTFKKHHFKLGPDGNPTLVPDDTPGVSDQADAMRYVAQNLFPVKGTFRPSVAMVGPNQGGGTAPNNTAHTPNEQMMEEIRKRVGPEEFAGSTKKKGGFHWSF